MTIGWGMIGVIWSRPVFTVLVRPSRHSYSRLEQISDFTVNVPSAELSAAVAQCGRVSGRDHDKFKDSHLTTIASREVRSPIIQECVVHYECRILHRNDLVPDALAQSVREQSYPMEISTASTLARSSPPMPTTMPKAVCGPGELRLPFPSLDYS